MSRIPNPVRSDYTEVNNYYNMWVLNFDDLRQISQQIQSFLNGFLKTVSSVIFGEAANYENKIYGVKMFPFEINTTEGTSPVMFGAWTIQTSTFPPADMELHQPLSVLQSDIEFVVQVPNFDKRSFLKYEPYSKYELYVPFVGMIPIDGRMIINPTNPNKQIIITYNVELYSGNATVIVKTDTDVLYETQTCLCVDIPFAAENVWQNLSSNILNTMITAATGGFYKQLPSKPGGYEWLKGPEYTTSNFVATARNPKTGRQIIQNKFTTTAEPEPVLVQKPAIEGGHKTDIPSVVNSILNSGGESSSIQISSAGDFSSFSSLLTPFLKITKKHIHDINQFGYYYGYAVAEEIALNQHSGYCELSTIHMDGMTGVTPAELVAIEDALKNGVILPDLSPQT